MLGRIQTARSEYSAENFKGFEEQQKQFKRNIKSKWGTNDLTDGACYNPLNSHKMMESVNFKKKMFYEVEENFENKYNVSTISKASKVSNRTKSTINPMHFRDGSKISRSNKMKTVSGTEGSTNAFFNNNIKVHTIRNSINGGEGSMSGLIMREGLSHKKGFLPMRKLTKRELVSNDDKDDDTKKA